MEHKQSRQFHGYLVTITAVVAAALLIRLLQAMGYTGFSPLFAALIVSAWFGGIGPAVLGIILTTLTAYYILPRGSGGQVYHEDFLRATVFTLTAMIAVAVHLAARRTEEAAKRDKHTAERASEAKTRLLAMVSHDLQGPLNPILMAVAVAESDPVVAERAKDSLKLIRAAVTQEIQLIEDLLDIARLATGKFKVSLAAVDVHESIEKATLACRQNVQEKNLHLNADLAARATTVKGDAGRLHQVFWNLLSNAVKFTPAGGTIAIRTFDTNAGQIGIEVRDNGVGITAEKLPFIFNLFEQGGNDVTSRFGGLGLGLAICRGIIEAHGGNITASSGGDGQGATFVARLPVMAEAISPGVFLDNSAG